MDVNHKDILISEKLNNTTCEIQVADGGPTSAKNASDVEQLILENGIDNKQLQSKSCVSQESDAKCTVKDLGDSFCKSEETPTNDVNVLSRLTEESKLGTLTENCLMNTGDKDAYDTHSDSIETLEEVSSNEDSREAELSDSLIQQIQLTSEQKQCDRVNERIVGSDGASKKCDSHSEDPTRDRIASTDSIFKDDDNNGAVGAMRPYSLSLANSLQSHSRSRSKSDDHVKVRDRKHVRKERTQSDTIEIQASKQQADPFNSDDFLSKSLPKGTIMRKGDLIEFVASDLEEKIRHSSPMSLTGSSVSSRRSSLRSIHSLSSSTSTSMATTSTASGMSRSPSSLYQQSPDDIPPIDPQAIIDLENQARLVADSIDLMMGNLRGSLHKMSAISVGCLDAYQRSVDITCDSVDSSIKAMYALMAKCEELSHSMKPVYQIAHQIREIKRLLDLFEDQLTDK